MSANLTPDICTSCGATIEVDSNELDEEVKINYSKLGAAVKEILGPEAAEEA